MLIHPRHRVEGVEAIADLMANPARNQPMSLSYQDNFRESFSHLPYRARSHYDSRNTLRSHVSIGSGRSNTHFGTLPSAISFSRLSITSIDEADLIASIILRRSSSVKMCFFCGASSAPLANVGTTNPFDLVPRICIGWHCQC